MAHEIFDYKVQNQIFHVSGGYPIITYFLAEDYKLKHRVAIKQPIAGINEYYDTLFINNEKPSSAIGVFASGNCFFTWKELESFFVEPEMYEVICEFIEMHPYLFKVIMNRVSLIHDSFTKYIDGDKECINNIVAELSTYGFNKFWIDSSLSAAEYQLHELGYFGKNNKLRNISLYDLIMKNAKEGAYGVVTLAASYLKLANYEKRQVDISSLAYCWSMYFEHKDYSVFTIDNALITFEEENLIQENESFEMLSRLMQQSDKGISDLLTSYINKKESKFIKRFIENKYFERYNSQIRFWELNSKNLDCFSKKEMTKQITELLINHYYSKTIEGRDIQDVMESKYRDMLLDGIEYYGYSILSPNYNLILKLEERNIKYIGTEEKGKEEYVPLQDGCIHEYDFQHISEQKLGYLEIAQYTSFYQAV